MKDVRKSAEELKRSTYVFRGGSSVQLSGLDVVCVFVQWECEDLAELSSRCCGVVVVEREVWERQ